MSGAAVHLVIGAQPAPFEDAVLADLDAGRDAVIVLGGDRVMDRDAFLLRGRARVVVLADDVRRRGLPVRGSASSGGGPFPHGAIDYDELIDLIASADRVVSW